MSYKRKPMLPLERDALNLNNTKGSLLTQIKFGIIKYKHRIEMMKELEPQIKSAKNLDEVRELSKKIKEIENTVV